MPKISVLMTVFNAENFLRESLESLVNQDFIDWEAIVVENGSKDSSKEILSSFPDFRIKPIYFEENIGRTEALNIALGNSNSEYIAILDADDIALRTRFSVQIRKLESAEDVGLVGSWAEFIDSKGKFVQIKNGPEVHELIVKKIAKQNPFVHSSIMFRRDLAVRVGGYDPTFVYAQDFDLIMKIAAISRVEIIPEVLCKWRVVWTSQTNSTQSSVARAHDEYVLFKQVKKLHHFGLAERFLNLRQIIITRILYALALYRARAYEKALKVALLG